MDNYRLKLSIFVLLVILLTIILYYGLFGFSVSYLSEKEIKESREAKENLISYFKINNIDTVYNKNNDTYYYTIPDNYENKKYTLKLELDDGYKYKILNHATNVITVKYNKEYDLIIYNDKYYYKTKLIITNLPLVSITTDSEITDNETNSTFKYINPYNLDEIITHNSKINIRGATTKRYNKKSYKIKMYDNDYDTEKNVNISNFYYGSSYILDAMFRDNSKIRNVFAINLWNKISDDFTNVDIYSEYVELFINNEYIGLYTFTEPINRKSLNLNKSGLNDTSVIVKSNESTIPTKDNKYLNINEDTYLDYELKYPNDKNLYSISWNKILNKMYNYYNSNIEKTEKNLSEILDINNYIDLLIFNSFIGNNDNDLKKNNYFYLKDLSSKLNIQPWDMEFCFGLNYSDNTEYNFLKNMENYKDINFKIDDDDLFKIKKLIVNRYWVLRQEILNKKNLDILLDNYKNNLNKGAADRDTSMWIDYDVEKEIEEIRVWLYKRIEVYDNYITGLENE